MSLARIALAAAAACALGVSAYAQTTDDNAAPPAPAQAEQAAPADQSAPPTPPADSSMGGSMSGQTADQTAMGAAANASVTVNAQGQQVVASQPVPDTPQNRAQYGQPMSRAGKLTKPTGD